MFPFQIETPTRTYELRAGNDYLGVSVSFNPIYLIIIHYTDSRPEIQEWVEAIREAKLNLNQS